MIKIKEKTKKRGKIMKNIKIMFLFASITFFASIPLSVEAAERDCTDPQGFHEKMIRFFFQSPRKLFFRTSMIGFAFLNKSIYM